MANLGLLRRCHILQLFRETYHFPGPAVDRFIVDTAKDFSDRAKSGRVIPSNLANAEVTKAIVNEVYPTST